VVVLHREYNPTIKRDFRMKYNVHFACGLIVFGLNASRDRLIVKSGNAKVADALKFFMEEQFDIKLNSLRNDIFSDYDPRAVEIASSGASFLLFNDAGWPSDLRDKFDKQFQSIFGGDSIGLPPPIWRTWACWATAFPWELTDLEAEKSFGSPVESPPHFRPSA